MTDHPNFIIETLLFLKHYKRKDGRKQVIIRIKLGRKERGKKVFTSTHDINLLDSKGDCMYSTTEEFKRNNKFTNKELMARFYKVDTAIRKSILRLIKEEKYITTSILNEYVYGEDYHQSKSGDEMVFDDFVKSISTDPIPREVYEEISSGIFIDELTNEPVHFEMLDSILDAKLSEYYGKLSKEKINRMTPDERYQKGHFDIKDIFQIFGFCLSENKRTGEPFVAKSYTSLIMRLFDYYVNTKPKTRVNDFNMEWIDGFLTFFARNGYANCHIKNFDQFSFNNPDFINRIRNAKRLDYSISTFKKLVKHFKRYIVVLQGQGLLPPNFNPGVIEAKNYIGRNVKEEYYTRQEHSLTVEEFYALANKDFEDEALNLTRDMFIIGVLGGGLRTSELYNKNLSIQNKRLHIYRNKGKTLSQNPINFPELAKVFERHGGIPKFIMESDYNKNLKSLAEIMEFNRVIPIKPAKMNKGENPIEYIKVSELFSNYFARKTCVTILDHLGFTLEQIISFTEHSDAKTIKYYKGPMHIDRKEKLLADKLGTLNISSN